MKNCKYKQQNKITTQRKERKERDFTTLAVVTGLQFYKF